MCVADDPTAEVEVVAESESATEPVTDPIVEEPSPEETPDDSEASEPTEVDPNTESDSPAVEEAQPTLPDLSGLTVTELRERNPELAQALEYAGEQRREAQLRREAGSHEETRKRVAEIKSRLSEVAEGDAAGLDFVYENAAAHSRGEVMRAMASQAVAQFNPDAEERQALEAAAANLDGSGLELYAAQMVSLAADRVGRRTVYDMAIDDIPSDSKLAQSARARETKRIEAELKAAAIKPASDPPPDSPQGRPVVADTAEGNPLLLKLEKQGRSALTDAELEKAHELLGVKPS